jgi:PBP1b-binding outer membrane lipoprotein LpoB
MFLTKSALTLAALLIAGCQAPPAPKSSAGPGNPDTAAGKAGKLAYKVEKETEKVAKEAGKKIDQAARDAHAGYKTAEKKSDK